ncbi:MAG: DUF4102 domain-containing protein [Anaerolineales bacterium]|nr:DUF4102 domain-containing protein [Anaerolineales bacterium]
MATANAIRSTDIWLRNLKPAHTAARHWETAGDIPGFGVAVTPAGGKSFVLYFTSPASGKRIMFSLGRWPAVSLTEARKPARAARELLDVGQCPRAFEQTQEAAQEIEAQIGTVDSLFTEYIASLRRDNKRSADYVEKLRTRTVSPHWLVACLCCAPRGCRQML